MSAAPFPYQHTATFRDGTVVTIDSVSPYLYVVRSARGTVTWHGTRASAERAAGKRGEIRSVVPSEERYTAWLRDEHGIADEAQLPDPLYFDTHGCERQHRSYATLTRCRWPNNRRVVGEGRYGVYTEPRYHYGSCKPAVWPVIYLLPSLGEAQELCEDVGTQDSRRTFVFMWPDDLDSVRYDGLPFTQEGNRERYSRG